MMVERILKCLKNRNIKVWKLQEETIVSRELFFIKKELDMNRSKDVRHYELTIYRDFTEGDQNYRGSALIKIHPTLNDSEIEAKIDKAYFSASFVKNPFYPLPLPAADHNNQTSEKRVSPQPVGPSLATLVESLYKNDNHVNGGINSAEVFINRIHCRLLNSSGIDVSFTRSEGIIELICEWQEEKESVELYNMFSFSDVDGRMIEDECRSQIENCRLRAEAEAAPHLSGINIILTGEAVKEMMDFYLYHGSARAAYEKTAEALPGKVFQGTDAQGDLVNISLEPELGNSPYSVPYDADGILLNRTELYRNGELLRYQGSQQYSSYLGVSPTGNIRNISVKSGESSLEEWRKEPHVEIRTFSDFQMDPLTGDFGGEIRLALYFDGERTIPITGATLSASLFDVQKNCYLSQERYLSAGYDGPGALMFPGGTLGGS